MSINVYSSKFEDFLNLENNEKKQISDPVLFKEIISIFEKFNVMKIIDTDYILYKILNSNIGSSIFQLHEIDKNEQQNKLFFIIRNYNTNINVNNKNHKYEKSELNIKRLNIIKYKKITQEGKIILEYIFIKYINKSIEKIEITNI